MRRSFYSVHPCLLWSFLWRLLWSFVLASSVATAAVVSPPVANPLMQQGIYVGIGAVMNKTTANIHEAIDYYDDIGTAFSDIDRTQNPSNNQLGASLSMGYAFLLPKSFALHIALFAQSQNNPTFSVPANTQQINPPNTNWVNNGFVAKQQRFSYGLLVSPGYLIDAKNLLLLDLGVTNNSIDNQFASSKTTVNVTDYDQLNASSQTKSVLGYLIGLGFEHALAQQLSAVAHVNYQALQQYSVSRQEIGVFLINRNEKYAVSINGFSANIGVQYYF